MSIKISFNTDGEKGKTQGVLMPEKENDIPQIVGLSKKQFFGFLIATLLMGAGIFGIGYTLAYFNKSKYQQESHLKGKKNKNIKYSQALKKLENEYVNEKLNSIFEIKLNENEANEVAKKYYVTLGIYKNDAEAQKLIYKLNKLGKTGHIQQNEHGYMLYLGPYDSLSLAQNEIDSIAISSSLNGSIIHTLD